MNARSIIYLDHNATTPLCAAAREAMLPFLSGAFGNPSSYHYLGRQARKALAAARRSMADVFSCDPDEVVFTGGGTEANNLALRGAARALKDRGRHIITTTVEHHSVLKTAAALSREGFAVTYVPVDSRGVVDLQSLRNAVTPETILISVMYANNETGVVQPVGEIADIARQKKVSFHTDAVQAVGKLQASDFLRYADMASIAAHKMYGPQGAGALLVRRGTPLAPIMTGGHHEHGLRPGTENMAAIAGFAAAAVQSAERAASEGSRLAALRDRFEDMVQHSIPNVTINSREAVRVPNTSNICFEGVESESMLLHLDLLGICASSGSACTTGEPEPSHVLRAMGLSDLQAQGAVRFSLGSGTTRDQLDAVAESLGGIVKKLRHVSSFSVLSQETGNT